MSNKNLADTKAKQFRAMHRPGEPFVIPNPWDAGSARVLEGSGFQALATTSSGLALTKGRHDYGLTREDVITHCGEVADAVDVPVTADLENGWGLTSEDASLTLCHALKTSLAGGSIEDSSGDDRNPIIEASLAVERMSAAAEAINKDTRDFVLTGRAEAFLYGEADLDEVISRLQAFAEVGADVLYAPGLPDMDAVRVVCKSVSKPVNVLVMGALANHTVQDFANAGAARLSLGGALAWSAYGTLAGASTMLSSGTFEILSTNQSGAKSIAQHLRNG